MSQKHFSMADIHSAQKQIKCREALGLDIDPQLIEVAEASVATAEAGTGKTNLDSFVLDKVRAIYFATHIESDGPIPGKFSLLSVGMNACAIETMKGELISLDPNDPINSFYTDLKPVTDNFDEEYLERTWLDRHDLVDNGTDPEEEMDDLYEWVTTLSGSYGGFTQPIFLGYPLTRSWMFIYWYLMTYSAKGSPFDENSQVDIATLFSVKLDRPFARMPYYRNGPKEMMLSHPDFPDSLGHAKVYGTMFNNLCSAQPAKLQVATI